MRKNLEIIAEYPIFAPTYYILYQMNTRILFLTLWTLMASMAQLSAQTPELLASDNKLARPLGTVMDEVAQRFGVRFKYNVDTAGLVVNYAPARIRPYSLEETLQNILGPFDMKAWDQGKNVWKIKPYEYPRRYDEDGRKMVAWLNSLYANRQEWEPRRDALRREVRERLYIDPLLEKCVPLNPIMGKVRRYDGYTVQNIALELLPGYYVCGSIYVPAGTPKGGVNTRKAVATKDGRYPVIICPNGHWTDGRYNGDIQMRLATLARMGAICIGFDTFGWGESELQVGREAHQSSLAHTYQALSAVRLLDYALTRKDVDPSRVASNGGSGGGTHAVLLATIDDRVTACCPVVSVCSHFDGGCPCESGMPIQYSQGGTCNIELLATFAPKPVMLVGDEGDWTHTYPEIEIPYLQRIYGFYGAEQELTSVFLPGERHDFNAHKRQAVYDFFIRVWNLPRQNQVEECVTIEEHNLMMSFGATQDEKGKWVPSGATAPANFETSVKNLVEQNYDKAWHQLYFEQRWAAGLKDKAEEWTASLGLTDEAQAERVEQAIYEHLRAVTKWHNEHPGSTTVPHGINPRTGERLRAVDLDIIADAAQPRAIHDSIMTRLHRELTDEQVEQILDKYTVGKVAFTLKGYHEIVPEMTAEEDSVCLAYLKEAREAAIDYKSMKEISEIFGIAKDKCELYFNTHGRNWRQMYGDYVRRRRAEKNK